MNVVIRKRHRTRNVRGIANPGLAGTDACRCPLMQRDGGCGACRHHHADGDGYFSLRQFTEPRFSTLEDSICTSKPLRSRYFNHTTWPVPSSDTP